MGGMRCRRNHGNEVGQRPETGPIAHGEGNGAETRKTSTRSREKKGERRGWRRRLERREGFKKYLPRDENEDREVDPILRIFQAYEAVTTSTTIRAYYAVVELSTSITRGWGRSLSEHFQGEVRRMRIQRSKFWGQQRWSVPWAILRGYVFNLDEVGISDWEDLRVKNVIAPASVQETTA
jgi:hypothetical protein